MGLVYIVMGLVHVYSDGNKDIGMGWGLMESFMCCIVSAERTGTAIYVAMSLAANCW